MFFLLAEKHHMKFNLGLYGSVKYLDTSGLLWKVENNKYVIDEMWDKYGKKHKSLVVGISVAKSVVRREVLLAPFI